MQYPCDRFAAFLAHCLNSEDFSSITLDEGALYALLTDALATRYAQPMLHQPGYAWRMSPEEAAERYFEISIQRPLQMSAQVRTSVAHRFLEALCQRGVEPSWADASVQRELESPAGESIPRLIPTAVQKEFTRCSHALAKLPDRISPRSPSPTLRARLGPVVLRLYSLNATVPEEIGLWDGMACSPRTLKSLPRGKAFNAFCCLVIDGVRTAHRPYQELVGLGRGLCPFDWAGVLSIQQTRDLRKFLKVLEEIGSLDSRSDWERAWDMAAVGGFKSAAELWVSDIGVALRQPQGRSRMDSTLLENLSDPESASLEETLIQEDIFEHSVETLRSQTFINSAERATLSALYSGKTKSEILGLPGVREHLKASGLTYERFLESLEQRIQDWAEAQSKGES